MFGPSTWIIAAQSTEEAGDAALRFFLALVITGEMTELLLARVAWAVAVSPAVDPTATAIEAASALSSDESTCCCCITSCWECCCCCCCCPGCCCGPCCCLCRWRCFCCNRLFAAVTAAAAAALAAHAAAAAAAAVVAAAGQLNHPASSLVCGSSSTQKFFSDLLRFGFLTPLLEALAAAAVATAAIGLHRSVMYSPSLRCSTVTRAH